jgi:hypothetical protein
MVAYLTAIDSAVSLSGSEGRATRLLVGSHIRARAQSLGKRYAQLRQACDIKRPESIWLKETGESCVAFADSLYSLRLPSIFVLVPLVLSLGAKAAEIPHDFYIALLTSVSAALYLIAAPIVVISAFLSKRDIFLPGRKGIEQGDASADGQRNIYKVEDDLFAMLRQPKSREAQLDWLIEGTLLGLVIGAAGYLIFWRGSIDLPSDLEDIWVILAVLVPAVFIERRQSTRTWR